MQLIVFFEILLLVAIVAGIFVFPIVGFPHA